MSQAVRKLQKGDKAPQLEEKKLFRDGNRDIDALLILKNTNSNLQSYIDSKNWSRKKRQAFLDAYSDMITSINNGTISERNSGREYVDSSGKISNSKGRGFDAYGEAAHFIGTIVDALPDYDSKANEKKKDKYNSNGLITLFKNKAFGGNAPDMEIWLNRDILDEKTGKRGTSNRAEYFASIIDEYAKSLDDKDYNYEGSAYKDKEDLLARLQLASLGLRDGTFDNNDYNALTAIGISGDNARLLFSTGNAEAQVEPLDNMSLEAKDAEEVIQEELKRQQELEVILKAKQILLDNLLKANLTKEYIDKAKNFKTRSIYLPKTAYNKLMWANIIKGKVDSYYGNFERVLSKYNPIDYLNLRIHNGLKGLTVSYLLHLANNLDYLGDNIGEDLGNGYYYLPYTYNASKGTAAMYNPTTRHYVEEAVYKIPQIWNKIQEERRAEYSKSNFNFKEGGILTFQSGGYLRSKGLEAMNQEYLDSLQTSLTAEVLKKAATSGKTPEQVKAGSRKPTEDRFTATDWTRIGSAAADVASIVAAFVPGYGTAVSAGLGLGSTFATLGADIAEDGFQWSDLSSAAVNLGMDVVGLVPGFGAAGKSSKVIKNLVKYVPKLITIGTSIGVAPEAIGAFKKLQDPNYKLTVDDWRNLSSGLTAIAGLSRMGTGAYKARAMKKLFATGDKTITTKNGKLVRVTPAELEKIKGAKNLEEANKILQSTKEGKGQELASKFRGWYNPARVLHSNPRVGEHYQFKLMYDKKGNPVSSKWSDYGIYQGMVNSLWSPSMPNWGINLGIKNPYRIRTTRLTKPEPKQLLGLPSPRRFRIKEKTGFSDAELNRRGIYKEGGIIKAQNGMRNVISNNKVNWGEHIYGSKGFWDTLNMITPENIDTYNNMLNTYSTLGFKELKPGDNLKYSKQISDYQGTFHNNTRINTVTMLDLINKGIITGRGATTDGPKNNWKPDGIGGTETWLRHLGTKLGTTLDMLSAMNKNLNPRGVEAFYNDKTGMVNYRLAAKLNPETPTPSVNDDTNPSKTKENAGKNPTGFGTWMNAFADLLPNFIAAGRLAGNIVNNNVVAKETLKGLKPLLKDTYHLLRNIYGDLGTKLLYYGRAAAIENFAARPRTSDASLLLAGELDANVKGNELRAYGDMVDNYMIRQTAEQAWQTEADNIARHSEIDNANRASMLGILKVKHDVEAARKSANWQSIEDFLKEKEYRARTNVDRQRQFDLSVTENGLSQIFENPRLKLLGNILRTSDAEDITTLPEYLEYINLSKKLQDLYIDKANKAYSRIYGLRYRPYGNTWNPSISYKDGGKVEAARIKARTENARIFQNGINESVKNHIKLINNLSSVTKELIIKSMTL